MFKFLYSLFLLTFTCFGADQYRTITTGSLRTADSNPTCLLPVGNSLYYIATTGGKQGLWKSDGTAVGTVRLSDAFTVACPLSINGAIFFFLNNGLWKTDGTTGGTVHVTDLGTRMKKTKCLQGL
jgi:ELWxxDGT repeat protein